MARAEPQRRCIGCGATRPKAALMRLAVVDDCVVADTAAVRPGRGAYVCDAACLERALARRALPRAFRRSIKLPADSTNLLESIQN